MALAYLTSLYPATSHTFIRREVAALRRLGREIATFSVRSPAINELSGTEERVEAASTFILLAQPAAAFVRAHLTLLARSPLGYARTVWRALRHRPPGLRGLLLACAHFAEAMLLAYELRRRGIRHLHNHFANSAATVGFLASRYLGIGWSFTMHGISETDYPAGLLLPDKISAANMVVCVSWFGRAQAMRLVPPSQWSKFRVIRCGLSISELPRRTEHKQNPELIICVGRLSPEKGQAGLLDAFLRIRRQFPNAKLRLIGDGPERVRLERIADRLGLQQSVTFVGRLGEQKTLEEIARAGMLVLPSFMEGLPIVLMEAMALGVPVVSSRVAGVPELVRDGVNGLLFTPAQWDELGQCMTRLFEDPALGRRLAEEARATVEAEFDSDASARQLEEEFTRLLAMNSARSHWQVEHAVGAAG